MIHEFIIIMLKLHGVFEKLPNDIKNEIFDIYWNRQYYQVVKELDNINIKFNKINKSLDKFNVIKYSKEKYDRMVKHNETLEDLLSNKGTKLYSKINNNYFSKIRFDNPVFKNDKVGLIYQYVCNASSHMRFYVLEDYKKLISQEYSEIPS